MDKITENREYIEKKTGENKKKYKIPQGIAKFHVFHVLSGSR
jgi:hypothetical protein